MLRGDQNIGITLQSLDEKAFDHGTILAQTPPPGLPIPPTSSLQELTKFLAVEGARLLVQGLRDGVHVPPIQDVGHAARQLAAQGDTVHAPKVTKAESQVDWEHWEAEDFARRLRVFGALWTVVRSGSGESKRVILLDAERADAPEGEEIKSVGLSFDGGSRSPRPDAVVYVNERERSCAIRVREGLWICIRRVKVDGKPEQAAAVGLRSLFVKA